MKQISQFMSEISDEFKVIVVNAIRALCLKFPAKQSVMLNFLSGVLRDEGGYDFKRSVVEAIFDMIKFISDSKEAGELPLSSSDQEQELTSPSLLQLSLNCASSSKTASSQNFPFESFTCSESKDPRLFNPRNTFDTSTTESSSRTLSFGQLLYLPWPSSE